MAMITITESSKISLRQSLLYLKSVQFKTDDGVMIIRLSEALDCLEFLDTAINADRPLLRDTTK